MSKIKHVLFHFSPESLRKLDKLRNILGNITRTETISIALGTLVWLVKELERGSTILVEKKDGKILEMGFQNIPLKKQK